MSAEYTESWHYGNGVTLTRANKPLPFWFVAQRRQSCDTLPMPVIVIGLDGPEAVGGSAPGPNFAHATV
jgi:hypothetical protein